MSITLRQVAKLANTSVATASRVINNRPGVRPEIRERVWKIIRELDYQPDPVARSLARARTQKER